MKKLHVIALLCIAIAVVIFMSATDEMSTYATFDEAAAQQATVRVAGELVKDKPIEYNPQINPNYFSFYVKDANGDTRQVVLLAAKPQDFEMSEQIVVTGAMDGDTFVAADMLMKCPSKYKDEEIYVKSKGNS